MSIQQLEEINRICGKNITIQSHWEGQVPLPTWTHDNIVLLGSERSKTVFLICTEQAKGGQAFFTAVDECYKQNIVISKVLTAESSIIKTLYEHYLNENTSKHHGIHGHTLFDHMLEDAVKLKASDILIDNEGGWVYNIKFDIDTVVQTVRAVTPEEAESMMRYFYQNVADQDTVEDPVFSTHKAQFASGDGHWSGKHIRIRYQSKPSFPEGCIYSLRLLTLSDKDAFHTFEDLYISEDQTNVLKRIISRDTGAVLVAGVTGSGKTTTIKILIEEDLKQNPGKQICTAECPPEYIIKGARQHHVGEDTTGQVDVYAETIKELMRMRPDTMYIGEVRSKQTAELFAKAVLTGHVVLTTIHTDSPYEIITRLESEGLSREVIGSGDFVTALIYQKRFPKLCHKCKVPLSKQDEEKELIKRIKALKINLKNVHTRSEKGCKSCQHRGINGTIVCMDIVMPNHSMRRAIAHGDEDEFYNEWIKLCKKSDYGDAVETALYHALRHMTCGDISPKHIETRFGILDHLLLTEKTRTWNPKHGFTEKLAEKISH